MPILAVQLSLDSVCGAGSHVLDVRSASASAGPWCARFGPSRRDRRRPRAARTRSPRPSRGRRAWTL